MQTTMERNAAALAGLTTTPAIMAFLQARAGETDSRKGLRDVQPVDLSRLGVVARQGSGRTYGPRPYSPEGGGEARLRLREAVRFTWWHDSYADMAASAIPADIAPGADRAILRRNLARFAESIRSHTGLAGSGSTYEAELIENEAGALVVLTQRASIPD